MYFVYDIIINKLSNNREYFVGRDSMILCVCPHDKTKTIETKIAKLIGTGIVCHDTSPTN